jgi:Na+-driven multidrug efflux pump
MSSFCDALALFVGSYWLRRDAEGVAFLSIALIVVRVGQMAVIPFAKVFAVYAAAGDRSAERLYSQNLFRAVAMSLILVGAYYFAGDDVLRLWLRKPDVVRGAGQLLSILVLTLPAVTYYYMVRPILDVTRELPFTLLIGTASIAICVAGAAGAERLLGTSSRGGVALGIVAMYYSMAFGAWLVLRVTESATPQPALSRLSGEAEA